MTRLDLMEKLVEQATRGEKPEAKFSLPQQLTRENAMIGYTWVLLSNLYLEYTAIQSCLSSQKEISDHELANIYEQNAPLRDIRRYLVLLILKNLI